MTVVGFWSCVVAGIPVDSPAALYRLLVWLSPAYPVGGFTYSHGLEWAVESGQVTDRPTLVDYVSAVLERGGGWTDLVLLAAAWRSAEDPAVLDEVADLAASWRGTAETALESGQQGAAFAKVTEAAWAGTALDGLQRRRAGRPIAYAVAVGAAVAGLVPLEAALTGYGQAVAAGLVSAGLRLVPLGQTDGQHALAALEPVVARAAAAALAADADDLGTSAPGIDLCSMRHETQYTRLFRS